MPAIIQTNNYNTVRSTAASGTPGKLNPHRSSSFFDVGSTKHSTAADRLTALLVEEGVDAKRAPRMGEALHAYLEHLYMSHGFLNEDSRFSTYQFRQSIPQHSFLYDMTETPIAMCFQERHNKYGSSKIYGSEPLYNDQMPLVFERGVNLYPWFRVRDNVINGKCQPDVSLWRYSKFRPMHLGPATTERPLH